jgi:hypothetical protein
LTSMTTANTDINMNMNNIFGAGSIISDASIGNINTAVSPSLIGSGPKVGN